MQSGGMRTSRTCRADGRARWLAPAATVIMQRCIVRLGQVDDVAITGACRECRKSARHLQTAASLRERRLRLRQALVCVNMGMDMFALHPALLGGRNARQCLAYPRHGEATSGRGLAGCTTGLHDAQMSVLHARCCLLAAMGFIMLFIMTVPDADEGGILDCGEEASARLCPRSLSIASTAFWHAAASASALCKSSFAAASMQGDARGMRATVPAQ